jgi:hypothetical protein
MGCKRDCRRVENLVDHPAGWLFRNTLRVRCSARARHIFYELAANFII